MRPRVVIPVISALIICLVLVWLFRPKNPGGNAISAENAEMTNQFQNSPNTKPPLVVTTAQPQPPITGAQSSNSITLQTSNSSRFEELTNAMREWNKNVNPPIEFYGTVKDQYEQPVEGANIAFTYNQYTSPEGSSVTNAITDTNGFFSLSGVSGGSLGVSVAKDGYYAVKSSNHFNYTGMLGSERFYPDSRNPVVFHLKKKNAGAKLITSDNGMRRDLVVSGLSDGTVKRVDFFTQQIGNTGQMELSAFKPAPGQPQSEWWFRMSIPDGGLIEENDEFPFEAPESGYQSSVDFHFHAGATNWATTVQKNFYIKFGQPPKYGRVYIDTAIDRGSFLRYAINPDGARNLEPMESQPQPAQGAPPGARLVTPQLQ
jgi:hypothetical protein